MKSTPYSSIMALVLRGAPSSFILAAFLLLANASQAASAPELLERGIYQEETKGDLDSALKIYQELAADAKVTRPYAAQAQYRIGLCLHKQKKYSAARAAFEKLIEDFPDQKELAALARQYLPGDLALEPVPWTDAEELQLQLRFPGGYKLGTAIYRTDLVEADGRKLWRVSSRSQGGAQGFSQVFADPDTFRPIRGRWKLSMLGDVETEYRPGHAEIKNLATGESKRLDLAEISYDNEQVIQMVRRLPLAEGYKASLQVVAALAGPSVFPIELTVTSRESVKVPAGVFDCFKVEMNIQQTFWYTADARRLLVKFEAGGVVAELLRVSHRPLGQGAAFDDAELGVSFTVPGGWNFWKNEPDDGDPIAVIALLDPQGDTRSAVVIDSLADIPAEDKRSIQAYAKNRLAKEARRLKDFNVRAGSWQDRSVAGLPASSVIADYVEGDKKMARYLVVAMGQSRAMIFGAELPAGQLEAFQGQFDKILATCRMTP